MTNAGAVGGAGHEDRWASGKLPSRVLVVEDDFVARTFTVRALLSQGISCDVATNGLEAEAKLREAAFDIVIVDLRMPGKHGYALIRDLLMGERRPVIIVYTSILEPRLACDLLERGVDDILFKPIEGSVLVAKIVAVWRHRVLGRSSASRVERTSVLSLDEARDILNQTWSEPLVSPVAADIYRMVGESTFQPKRIAQVLARDAALVTAVVDLANCACFNGYRERVASEEQAIQVLGPRRLGELVIGSKVLFEIALRAAPNIDCEIVTRQGVASTMAADALVRHHQTESVSQGVLLGAMLATAGHALLATAFGEQYESVLEECRSRGVSLIECERLRLAQGGPEAIAWLLGRQGIDAATCDVLAHAGKEYATLLDLSADQRFRAEYVKAASLIGRIAAGRWREWDLIELPPASAIGCLTRPMLDEILRDARQGAAGFGPPVRSCPRDAESPPSVGTARVIPYFALNGGTVDLMPALLAMLGYDVTPATRDDLKKHPATLVNCHGANSDNSAGWERWSGKLVALSGNDADSRRVSLPCSVGQLRALAAQVGQRCAARTSVEPGPFLPTDSATADSPPA